MPPNEFYFNVAGYSVRVLANSLESALATLKEFHFYQNINDVELTEVIS